MEAAFNHLKSIQKWMELSGVGSSTEGCTKGCGLYLSLLILTSYLPLAVTVCIRLREQVAVGFELLTQVVVGVMILGSQPLASPSLSTNTS